MTNFPIDLNQNESETNTKVKVEHVAVAALKWEIIEKGHSYKFDALKDALEGFGSGTPQLQVVTNYVIMREIQKFVAINEQKEAKEECEQIITLAKQSFSYFKEVKYDDDFFLRGFFWR